MYEYQKNKYQQTCDKCGAVFDVIVPGLKGHEESEEYFCPECFMMYMTRASNTPKVILITKRTDGKIDKCSNPYDS